MLENVSLRLGSEKLQAVSSVSAGGEDRAAPASTFFFGFHLLNFYCVPGTVLQSPAFASADGAVSKPCSPSQT